MTTTLPAAGPPAAAVAEGALRAAGVTVRRLDTLAGVRAAAALFGEVWRSPGKPPLSSDVMRAVEHAGGYVVGAYDGGRMLAASSGFLALGHDGDVLLHSHISGVLPEAQGRRVGLALKLHQRAWALERGIQTITWTFDPLVRRNAWFNLVKLGAVGVEYLVDFYGPMDDGLNAGEPTDRLFTRWDLLSPSVQEATEGLRPTLAAGEGRLLLDEQDDGRPVVLDSSASAGPVLVRLPAEIESLRAQDPQAASTWRLAVREVLAPLVDGGGRVTGVTADGCLVVTP